VVFPDVKPDINPVYIRVRDPEIDNRADPGEQSLFSTDLVHDMGRVLLFLFLWAGVEPSPLVLRPFVVPALDDRW
jgi:hypothetical protein